MHILMVEDEGRLAALMRRRLSEERHTVDLIRDGITGLALALAASRAWPATSDTPGPPACTDSRRAASAPMPGTMRSPITACGDLCEGVPVVKGSTSAALCLHGWHRRARAARDARRPDGLALDT